jgi:transcriptional regulator with XRE-family HTH domain
MLCQFGDKLRYLRLQSEMTQSELARQVGTRRAHINNLEAGRRLPSMEFILSVAHVFNVALDYLVRDTLPAENIVHSQPAMPPSKQQKPCLFGNKLRNLRINAGLKQSDIAQRLGLASHSHVSSLEANRREPSIELVVHIADLFGVTTDYLLRDDVAVEGIDAQGE